MKHNPKQFFGYLNSKRKIKSGVSELKDKNGKLCEKSLDNANILGNFFASTFVLESQDSDFVSQDTDLNDKNVRNIAKNTVQTLPNKDINIINLSYSYQNSNKLILKKISLTIKKNTTVGIVGLTGSGKTTLINLIM